MMKRNNNYKYSDITSFEDFYFEKERLILKRTLIEARINMDILLIRKAFSVSNIVLSLAREFVLGGLSGFIEEIFSKRNKN
jgi:hypothetical protein